MVWSSVILKYDTKQWRKEYEFSVVLEPTGYMTTGMKINCFSTLENQNILNNVIHMIYARTFKDRGFLQEALKFQLGVSEK